MDDVSVSGFEGWLQLARIAYEEWWDWYGCFLNGGSQFALIATFPCLVCYAICSKWRPTRTEKLRFHLKHVMDSRYPAILHGAVEARETPVCRKDKTDYPGAWVSFWECTLYPAGNGKWWNGSSLCAAIFQMPKHPARLCKDFYDYLFDLLLRVGQGSIFLKYIYIYTSIYMPSNQNNQNDQDN